MSTIKVDTIATRTGSGNITVSNDTAFSTSVLVGKTSSNIATEGIELRANDDVMITQSGDTCLYLNRLSSDGSIVDLRKDGTTVGTVGANASRSFISGPQKGIKFGNASADPCTNTGAAADNSYDLGGSSIRYKDLYLSGGVLVGGTGTANKLDDYEEGTWTPNCATPGVSGSYSVQLGQYIKIGKLVQCIFNLTTSGSYTGNTTHVFRLGGLPFANKAYNGSLYAGGNIGYYFNINTVDTCKQMVYQIPSGASTSFELKGTGDNSGEISIVVSNMNSNSVIRGQLVYHTA